MAKAPHDLKILPGFYTLNTDRGSRGRWREGQWVRFKDGLPEKIGGYQKASSSTFQGKARGVIDWVALDRTQYIGFGTHLKLYVYSDGTFYDITPVRASSTINTDPFSMTNLSAVVTVTDTAHGATDGDFVTFSGATAAGGITINGEYQLTYIDADSYTITHSSAATSTTTGGGAAVTATYQISIGVASSAAGSATAGWGAGAWGSGTWGTARTLSSILYHARTWSLATWGEDMIACPRGGKVYVWDKSSGTGTRATLISQAPATVQYIFMSDQNRQIVALGAYDGSADAPMRVAWCDAEDYTVWTAADGNTAGAKRLEGGNELLCAVEAKLEAIIFSDAAAWAMTFDGPPYTFGFRELGSCGGLRGPNAAIQVNGRVYWMGSKDFYVYEGSINVLPCEVVDYIFNDIDPTNKHLVFAGANRDFNEVWWLYPSYGASECDSYVIYNTEERVWAFGTLARTAIVADSDVFAYAYAFGADGYLYVHETGVDAENSALSAYIESWDAELGEGEYLMHVTGLIPDFARLSGSVDVVLKGRKYPNSSEQISTATLVVTPTTEFINPHLKCRQVALRLSVDAQGDDFRAGIQRLIAGPHGKK